MEERIQKLISRAGLASRRTAEQMIVDGRVRVDGRIIKELGTKADPDRNDIRVDGRRLPTRRPRRYILLNKPAGYVTTRSDSETRRTVMDLLPHSLRSLYPAGRLDMGTTGLLVMTDDGEFAQRVTHPRYGIEKTYVVTVRGVPSEKTLNRAKKGIRVEGQKLQVASIETLLGRAGSSFPPPRPKEKARLRVTLVEGKNREIRRLFQALGHPVVDLHRSQIGFLDDRGLPVGAYRPLTLREVRRLWSAGRRRRRPPSETGPTRRTRGVSGRSR